MPHAHTPIFLSLTDSCVPTLDENTANTHLAFSEGRSQVSFLEEPQLYSERPERFAFWPQVLCRESLSHRSYWELWWTGHVDVGVAYKTMNRKLEDSRCVLGQNDQSWSLECHDDSNSSSSSGGNDGAKQHGHRYCAWRNGKRVEVPSSGLEEGTPHVATPSSSSSRRRVGVYLDWPGGNLSFYCVSTDAIQHLHTYRATFTEPLFAGFMVWPKASVTLCKIRRRGQGPLQHTQRRVGAMTV
ncbi:neoverrucotoxin subunit alpha-like [Engraulis encrasicolus]|uniref:neoverrucotoxin subunit alpha-like n=1 Tax=Engraulis encrasicolus TaxID=184585 RepID=UPI002FD75668